MKAATITSKGQVTIPKRVRDALNLKPHDRVIFVVDGDRAILKPLGPTGLDELRGIFQGRVPYPGREAERDAAKAYVARRVLSVGTDEHRED